MFLQYDHLLKLFVGLRSLIQAYFLQFVRLFFLSSLGCSFVRFCLKLYFVHSFVCLFICSLDSIMIFRLPDVSRFCFNFLDKLLHFRNRGKIDIEKDSRTETGEQ